jgi:hypothetical protein
VLGHFTITGAGLFAMDVANAQSIGSRGCPSDRGMIPIEQSSYPNDGFLRLGEIVSGAEAEGTPND